MSDITMIDPRYKVQRTCSACRGEGIELLIACPECGELITADFDWEQAEYLSCGHEVTAVQADCQVCQGSGSVPYILTEEEYQQLRRKRLIRGIFLLILALIPLILLLLAIISRDPNLRFGAPWY